MPEVEVLNFHGLIIRIRSDDEELLKHKKLFKNLLMSILEHHYGIIEIFIEEEDFRTTVMSMFEYANFDLILDSSRLEHGCFQMRIIGELEHTTDKEKRTNTFHFEFDERGDKTRIYYNYKMFGKTPSYMITRTIIMKNNKFLRWVISSYPEDIKILYPFNSYLIIAIEYDNAEAFHLLEQLNPPNNYAKFLVDIAENDGRPEYADYIKNHYDM